MNHPFLSVIVPLGPGINRIRNIESWLETALDRYIEVIIIHDTVDQDEIEIFTKIVEKISDSRLITTVVNFRNPGETRNVGKALATGEWVAFWDSDDLPLIDNFISMVNSAHSAGASTCLGGFQISHTHESQIGYFLPSKSPKKISVDIAAYPGIWRFAFKQTVIKEVWFQKFCMGEDQAFILEAIENISNSYVHQGIVYEYRKSDIGQLTSSTVSRSQIFDSILWLQSGSLRFANNPLFELVVASQTLTSLKELGLLKALKLLARNMLSTKSIVPKYMFRILRRRKQMKYLSGDVIIYVTGGLGNQLFQVSRALDVAKGRTLCIANYKKDEINKELIQQLKKGSYYFQDETRIRSIVNPLLVSLVLRIASSKFRLVKPLQLIPRFISKIVNGWYTKLNRVTDVGCEELDSSDPNVLIGYFQSYLYVDKALLQASLNPIYSEKTSQVLDSYRKLSIAEEPTLVHIRLGDYRLESRFGKLDKSYYLRSLELIKAKSRLGKVWLFSNEPEEAINYFPREMHQNLRIINEATISPLENLEIMRMCSNYVIANSTYSWWAAFLSIKANPLVIYPSPWFEQIKSPRNIAPPSWIPLTGYNSFGTH